MTRAFQLAASLWPRAGGDRRNSGRVACAGPVAGRVVAEVALPTSRLAWRGAGLAVADDGAVLVVADGHLVRVGVDGAIASVSDLAACLAEVDSAAAVVTNRALTPPVALADGSTLVIVPPHALRFGPDGALIGSDDLGEMVDDSGLAPNLTHAGGLVITRISGGVDVSLDGRPVPVGSFGDDIVPPALHADDAMVIAGYAGAGLVCVAADGTRRWRAKLADPDLVPSIDRDGFVAAGSLSARRSIIVDAVGRTVGRLGRAAVFAEAEGGDWFARSADGLWRVGRDGAPRWVHPLDEVDLGWGARAPIADRAGVVHVVTARGYRAVDATTGAARFDLDLGEAPRALAVVGPGRAAVLCAQRLLLVA
jgi:hypothetical protein